MTSFATSPAAAPFAPPGPPPDGLVPLAARGRPAPATSAAGALADCSLVVPTYRRPEEIVALLGCLAALPDPPGEVVVVDGSPDAATADAVRRLADVRRLPFELLHVASPPGLTRQRNVGIDVSRGALVFFLDDDCRPEPGYFRALRRLFADDAASEIGAACGSIVNEMGRPLDLRWRLRLRLGLVPPGEAGTFFPSATSLPRSLVTPFAGSRPTDMLPGGASCWRRAVLDRHRFSLFFSGYSQGEDLEMSRRVARGWQLRWCGDAHVRHHHAPGGRPASVAKGAMEVRNRYFIWKRHVPFATAGDAARFWLDVAFILAYDVATFVGRPRQPWHLAHAAGVALGAAGGALRPPRHDEPPARREYAAVVEGG